MRGCRPAAPHLSHPPRHDRERLGDKLRKCSSCFLSNAIFIGDSSHLTSGFLFLQYFLCPVNCLALDKSPETPPEPSFMLVIVCSPCPPPTRSLIHMWETDPSCSHLPGPPLGALQLSAANGGVRVGIKRDIRGCWLPTQVSSPHRAASPRHLLSMASGYSRGW